MAVANAAFLLSGEKWFTPRLEQFVPHMEKGANFLSTFCSSSDTEVQFVPMKVPVNAQCDYCQRRKILLARGSLYQVCGENLLCISEKKKWTNHTWIYSKITFCVKFILVVWFLSASGTVNNSACIWTQYVMGDTLLVPGKFKDVHQFLFRTTCLKTPHKICMYIHKWMRVICILSNFSRQTHCSAQTRKFSIGKKKNILKNHFNSKRSFS